MKRMKLRAQGSGDICNHYQGADAWQKPAICRSADDDFAVKAIPAALLLVVLTAVWAIGRRQYWF